MRDLIVEQFSEIDVRLVGTEVVMKFPDQESAERACFLIKSALELGIPVQIRKGQNCG